MTQKNFPVANLLKSIKNLDILRNFLYAHEIKLITALVSFLKSVKIKDVEIKNLLEGNNYPKIIPNHTLGKNKIPKLHDTLSE